jgi:hypothetical protein
MGDGEQNGRLNSALKDDPVRIRVQRALVDNADDGVEDIGQNNAFKAKNSGTFRSKKSDTRFQGKNSPKNKFDYPSDDEDGRLPYQTWDSVRTANNFSRVQSYNSNHGDGGGRPSMPSFDWGHDPPPIPQMAGMPPMLPGMPPMPMPGMPPMHGMPPMPGMPPMHGMPLMPTMGGNSMMGGDGNYVPMGWLPPGAVVPPGYGAVLMGAAPTMPGMPPGPILGLGGPQSTSARGHQARQASKRSGSKTPKGNQGGSSSTQIVESEKQGLSMPDEKTTVMLQNLPPEFGRDTLLAVLGNQGFAAKYDFVYIPMNLRSQENFGYCFVNFVSQAEAQACKERLEGFNDWNVPSDKVCSVSWSDKLQGLEGHIERYRNSPVMHHSVDDPFKPAMFLRGERVSFPPPSKHVKEPRVRRPAV